MSLSYKLHPIKNSGSPETGHKELFFDVAGSICAEMQNLYDSDLNLFLVSQFRKILPTLGLLCILPHIYICIMFRYLFQNPDSFSPP
jgi:hypothetical protein